MNSLDELHRALRDIQRLTEIWGRIAKENADAWIEPKVERLKIRSDLEIDAKNNWSDWIKAVDRAHRAIDQADLARVDLSKSDLLKLVGRLNTLFPHSILSQSDGAHLLNGVHPLGAGARGISYFPYDQVVEVFKPINDIVDVLILVAPRFTEPAPSLQVESNRSGEVAPSHPMKALSQSQRSYLEALSKETLPLFGADLAPKAGFSEYRRPLKALIELNLAYKLSPRGGFMITPAGREYVQSMRP